MKNLLKLSCLVFLNLFLVSCWYYRDPVPINTTFSTYYKPTLMSRSLLESSISYKPARTIEKAGKIYLYGNFIFINEKYKGFHVIDNTSEINPTNIGFINVPGCLDMAIKSDIVYIDNATDLVALDISNVAEFKVTKRIRNTFKEPSAPDGGTYTKTNLEEDAIIVGWSSGY